MRTSNETNEKQYILHVQRAFFYNLYDHDVKFPIATLEDVNTGTNSFSSLRPNLGVVPRTVRKVQLYLPFKRVEVNAKKF